MSWLIDTNVVSEAVRPEPDPQVRHWLATVDRSRAYLSVVTVAELVRGIDRLSPGRRRRTLERWLAAELLPAFADRLLPIDGAVAAEWGRLVARLESRGRSPGTLDAFLAATARLHGLTLVTRNVDDFADAGIACLDPWRASAH